MSPTWKSDCGRVVLYCADCREVLPTLVQVDAIISDPPYGIAYKHSGCAGRGGAGNTKHADSRGNRAIIGDNAPFDPRHMLGFENVLLFGANYYATRLPEGGRWLAWNKLGDMEPWDSFSDVEFAWHSRGGSSRIFSMKWKGLACEKNGENGGRRDHPTQKPIRLMVWCLEQAKVSAEATVVDPYMGVGTTGVACIRTGRRFIGVELDPAYFATAVERIKRELAQGDLFRDSAAA